ncbi:tRNA glutamyl-Q(34) synthetase GluQRS [Methylobacterium persicinum]|uniref:Glutamyl-Q tRNA(Asp) synthetase n=1 Tax=Methylobacterium persicinum TaxID=374426 RepID=A0ABU0HRM3_9HYPH|nr:tRNA glutamyl-Q(34) synthetase GluQRS [Methylobacterium persicinum]MDQ0444976.1 glutamyl-Q tRNA(Asp) synthetase [Methylobacterium persicinum]GJE40379.1 Glutamate--tRNA ligase [Methylobacterium persicinum]
MSQTQAVLRFAPSPNGRLHLGHAYSALLNARFAETLGGVCRLRIEDIDPARSKPAFAEAIIDDLAWLGLTYPEPVRHQSRHMEDYRSARDRLIEEGLAYPCFCSRGEIRARAVATDPDGAPLYPGLCRNRDPGEAAARCQRGEPHTWRLDMARALPRALNRGAITFLAFDATGEHRVLADAIAWGDAVIARRDVPTSYHLSVVHDDALEGITHVVRGADLEAATGLHVLLQRLLGLPTPRYHHHPLLRDEDGRKLAKSWGSTSLAALRESGVGADEIRSWFREGVRIVPG